MSGRFRLLSVWSGLALLFFFATTAGAWKAQDIPPWDDGDIPLHLQLGNAPVFSDGYTPNTTAVEAAHMWDPGMGRSHLAPIVDSPASTTLGNGLNNAKFSNNLYGQPFDPGVLAVTIVLTTGGKRNEADVIVNANYNWDSFRAIQNGAAYDLRRVLAHEFGHVIGLSHPDPDEVSGDELMDAFYGIPTLSQDDLLGAAALYGPGSGGPGVQPLAIIQSTETTWSEGALLSIKGTLANAGPGVVQWYHNGVAVPGANKLIYQKTATLDDAGTYYFTIRTSAGVGTSGILSVTITPSSAPILTLSKAPPALIYEGGAVDNATFIAKGAVPMEYTWRRDGVIVQESTSPRENSSGVDEVTLSLAYALRDSGTYTLTAKNARGTTTSQPIAIMIRPRSVPVIRRHPTSVTVTALGGSVTFTPAIEGEGLKIEWLKDGVILPGQAGNQLNISPVTAASAGAYTIRVTNSAGSVESQPAYLTVDLSGRTDVALRIMRHPQGMEFMAPGAFVFKVVPGSGTTPRTFQWYKDGVAIPGANGFEYNGFLSAPGQAASYTFAMTDRNTRVVSAPAVLTIHPAAQFTPHIRNQLEPWILAPGQRISWWADVPDADAPSRFQWFRNGVPISDSAQNGFDIAAAQLADTGDYSVTVSNAVGSTTRTVGRLSVISTPFPISSQPMDLEVIAGITWKFFFRLNSSVVNPAQDIQAIEWQHNGAAIPGAASAVALNLQTGATPSDAGTYRAVITLKSGDTITTDPATLTVLPLPLPRLSTNLGNWDVVPNETVRFEALTDASPVTPSYQWWHDGSPVVGATGSTLTISPVRPGDAGTYKVTLTNPSGTTTSNDAVVTLRSGPPPQIGNPSSQTIAYGDTAFLGAAVSANENTSGLTYQWYKEGAPVPGATSSGLNVIVSPDTAGRYYVVATSPNGTTQSADAVIEIQAGTMLPLFTLQPVSQRISANSTATFAAVAIATAEAPTYQWRRNGVDLPGQTAFSLSLAKVDASAAGFYTVVATNKFGSIVSQPAELAVEPAGRLLNLSARALSRGGDDILIAGFVVQGPGPKRILIRGVGPTLTQFGVAATLTDPALKIYDAQQRKIQDLGDLIDSGSVAMASSRIGAFPLPYPISKEPAVIMTLEPGSYTAHVSNPSLTSARVGLAELYDLDSSTPRMINLSTRATVQPGEGALIAGFVVDQGAPKRVLVRAVGPGLAPFNVSDRLADPKVQIVRSSDQTVIAENDNWSASDAATMEAAFNSVGAFGLTRGSTDAALIATLPAGTYTAVVTGTNGGSGQALVEVYEMPAP